MAIDTHFSKQFGDTIMLLSQQKGSRLRNAVLVKSDVVGEETYMDQMGADEATRKTTRNGDTPITQADEQRVRITMYDYEWAKLLDKQDKLKMIVDPTSSYVINGRNAMGRAMDDEILDNATGTSYRGKAGGTSTSLPSSQKVAVGSTGLTVAKLLSAKEILDGNEVDEEEQKFCVCTAKQITNMLNTTEVKSADYNTVKALAKGEIDTFLGFKFIRSQRCNLDGSNNRQVLCYAKSGLGLAIAKDIEVDIGPRRDKGNAQQVYICLGIGAARLEEKKVVEVACSES